MHTSTIAKIEGGERGIQIEEAVAFANVFGVSIDALVGRVASATDLVWAVSKLTAAARKAVSEIEGINERFADELQDVRHYAKYDGAGSPSVTSMIGSAVAACEQMKAACVVLSQLSNDFPLLGGRTHE